MKRKYSVGIVDMNLISLYRPLQKYSLNSLVFNNF